MSEFKAKVSLVIMGHKFPMPPSFSGIFQTNHSPEGANHIGINSQRDVEDLAKNIERTLGVPLRELGLIKGAYQIYCNGKLPSGVFIDVSVPGATELTD